MPNSRVYTHAYERTCTHVKDPEAIPIKFAVKIVRLKGLYMTIVIPMTLPFTQGHSMDAFSFGQDKTVKMLHPNSNYGDGGCESLTETKIS